MRLGALAFSPPLSYISQVVKAPQLQSSPYVAPQVTQHFFSSQRGPVLRLTAARRTAVATDDTSDSDGFSSESLSNFRSSQPRRAVPKPPSADVRKVTLALLQLLAVVACLILLPAWLCCKTIPPRAWLATALYTVFFGAGALRRTLKYGKLSSRKKDAQVSTEQGKWAIILFVVLVVAGHWEAMMWYGACVKQGALVDLYTLPGVQYLAALLLPTALALHVWATETLGKAYDRLVTPDHLVTSGPYAWCQHPIYTSYMLLFSGFMLWFGSEECCIFMLFVCWRYYAGRIKTEAELLEQAFGNQYVVYKEHTGAFLPRLF